MKDEKTISNDSKGQGQLECNKNQATNALSWTLLRSLKHPYRPLADVLRAFRPCHLPHMLRSHRIANLTASQILHYVRMHVYPTDNFSINKYLLRLDVCCSIARQKTTQYYIIDVRD